MSITLDYSYICETSSFFETVHFCNFNNGYSLNNHGPNTIKKFWEEEEFQIKSCIITNVIIGELMFNKVSGKSHTIHGWDESEPL